VSSCVVVTRLGADHAPIRDSEAAVTCSREPCKSNGINLYIINVGTDDNDTTIVLISPLYHVTVHNGVTASYGVVGRVIEAIWDNQFRHESRTIIKVLNVERHCS
jgi:hypothetical protein